HRIISVLEHEHTVGDTDAQRPAGAAFANHSSDNRRLEDDHLTQVYGDGLGNVPFLSADSRVSTGRVDEGNDREPELVGQLHQPQRLAVTFRVRGTEVAQDVLFGIAALLGADHHDLVLAQAGEAPHN